MRGHKSTEEERPVHDDEHGRHYRPGELDIMTVLNDSIRELAETTRGDRGIRLSGAITRPLVPQGTSTKLTASPARFVGYNIRETAGGTALVRFHDGDINGDVVHAVSLTANQTLSPWWGSSGIAVGQALFAEVVNGAVELYAYLGGR